MNHYIALVNASGYAQATLPHSASIDAETGEVSGLEGALSLWNGPPPVWCWEIVEVRSELTGSAALRNATHIWRRT